MTRPSLTAFAAELTRRGLATQVTGQPTEWMVTLTNAPAVAALAAGMGVRVSSPHRYRADATRPEGLRGRLTLSVVERSAVDVCRAAARVLVDWEAALAAGGQPVPALDVLRPPRPLAGLTLVEFIDAVNAWDTKLRTTSRRAYPYTDLAGALMSAIVEVDCAGAFGDPAPAQPVDVEMLGTLIADDFTGPHRGTPVSEFDHRIWANTLAAVALMSADKLPTARALASRTPSPQVTRPPRTPDSTAPGRG